MTLIELVISISLIGLVVVFLFRLFVDVRHNDQSTDYDRNNQQSRALIIKSVQDDFLDNGLVGIDSIGSTNNQLIIHFTYKTGKGTLTVNNNSVTYLNAKNERERWLLSSIGTYNVKCVSYNRIGFNAEDKGDFFAIQIRIPLSFKKDSPNAIDDLEFSYLGKKSGVDLSKFVGGSSLGSYNQNSC